MTDRRLALLFDWQLRLQLYAEGNKLLAKGLLRAEGRKLLAEGDLHWANAVLQVCGNITMGWENWNVKHQSYECHLGTGEVFGFE